MTSDEKALCEALETFASEIEAARDKMLSIVAPIVARNPVWYNVPDTDGDMVFANERELSDNLDRLIPKFEDCSLAVESAGFDYDYLIERIAGEAWAIVKKEVWGRA